jgi:ABC-type polysaccharide/polyol phosphate transport system ATPase subunit
MARIELDNVSLTFRVRQDQVLTLKEFLVKRLFRPSFSPRLSVEAIKELSLKVRQGERLGIIGHNGAGKSTLLKLLAGIYPPTAGTRVVEGKICSLFDISLGFELEATGWENIKFRGYLQGETPKSIRRKIKDIGEFSELGKFLDTPVRYYSAGMMVRLAFSIATAIEPEVLLIDEALGAGDMNFQQKARQRMREIIARAHLMVVVSHDLTTLEELCDRIVWMDHGRIRGDGKPDEVISAYKESMGLSSAQAA